jgi:hypothetical protein
MSTVIPRRSARLASKAPQSSQVIPAPMEDVVRIKYIRQPSEKPVGRPGVQTAEQPAAAPSANSPEQVEPTLTTEEHNKICKPCEKLFLVRQIQDYLTRISNLRASDTKVGLVIDLYALIEEKMAFLCSSDFSDNDRFVNVVHMKSIELQDQLKNAEITEQVRQAASTVLKSVHKKIHLYLIKNEVRDEIYNEFLEKFVKQF